MEYKIKRFSLYQKEFGIFRKMMEKTIKKEEKESYERYLDSILNPKVNGEEFENKIISDNKDNIQIKNREPDMRFPGMIPQNYTLDEEKLLMILMGRRDKNICDVYWNRCDGLETLAHELGHVKNYKGNILDRFIRKGAVFGNIFKSKDNNSGVINALVDVLSSKFINWEEQSASKKGYKLLEKYGLSKKDLKIAKENLDNAIKLYKSQSKISWRKKLVNSKIPQWLL